MSGKRLLDIVLGTLLAVAAVPVIAVLAVAVCMSLRTRRPFFLQERVGRGGRRFTVPKLRTLPPHVCPRLDKYAVAAVGTTRLGRFLRRTHLDELPQLLLVPFGRMSLVGPRPEMEWLLAGFDGDFVAARSEIRPGCTGLWQISTAAGRLIGEAPEYDRFYLDNARVRFDLWVIMRSVVVMAGGPPVSLDRIPRWVQGRGALLDATAREQGRRSPGVRPAALTESAEAVLL